MCLSHTIGTHNEGCLLYLHAVPAGNIHAHDNSSWLQLPVNIAHC
jgi:hypothetical protein